jgi:hypothetical protein
MNGPLSVEFVYNCIQNTLRSGVKQIQNTLRFGVKQISKADNLGRVYYHFYFLPSSFSSSSSSTHNTAFILTPLSF